MVYLWMSAPGQNCNWIWVSRVKHSKLVSADITIHGNGKQSYQKPCTCNSPSYSSYLTALYTWVKSELNNIAAKINSQSVFVRGVWYQSLGDCAQLSKTHVPDGQFQWFLDIIYYLHFVTKEIVDSKNLQSIDIHDARVKCITEQ